MQKKCREIVFLLREVDKNPKYAILVLPNCPAVFFLLPTLAFVIEHKLANTKIKIYSNI